MILQLVYYSSISLLSLKTLFSSPTLICMAMNLSGISTTAPEEIEARKRQAAKKRLKILASIVILSGLARVIIKDPKPPATPDYTQDSIRVIPGMLQSIPLSEQAKLDPRLLARMQEADDKARLAKLDQSSKGSYKPAEIPAELSAEVEAYQQQLFVYEKRRQQRRQEITKIEHKEQLGRPVLVKFTSGGYLKVERATRQVKDVRVRYDKTLVADLPKNLILAIHENAAEWEEPVPKGYKKLAPADGITVILSEKSAQRIVLRKRNTNEI